MDEEKNNNESDEEFDDEEERKRNLDYVYNVENNSFINTCNIRREQISFRLVEITLKDLLKKIYKKNKKNVIYSYPLINSMFTKNIIERLLSARMITETFTVTSDFKFFIGFDECKILYRFIYKDFAFYTKGSRVKWSDINPIEQKAILNSSVFLVLHDTDPHLLNMLYFQNNETYLNAD